jgi:hypothetical protein
MLLKILAQTVLWKLASSEVSCATAEIILAYEHITCPPIILCYIVFGISQQFFIHNTCICENGYIFYIKVKEGLCLVYHTIHVLYSYVLCAHLAWCTINLLPKLCDSNLK